MTFALQSIQNEALRIAADAQRLAPAPIAPAAPVDAALDASPASSQGDGFAAGFKQMLHAVDAQDRAAADKVADVDAGRSDDLVGAMLASQQASLSFSMLMQVRNKVAGAFDELIKLQL